MAKGLFGGGNGTERNPYLVEDAQDLVSIKNAENPTQHYRQKANIDLSHIPSWNPIGNVANGPPFMGVYDGNNFVIENLTIDNTDSSFAPYIGLFGLCNNSSLKRVKLRKANVRGSGGQRAGILVGSIENSVVSDCSVEGLVSVPDGDVGGLTYSLGNGSKLSRCSAENVVVEGHHAGGLTAYTSGDILDCYATGEIYGDGSSSWLGGLAYSQNGGTITNCYASIVMKSVEYLSSDLFPLVYSVGSGTLESLYVDITSGVSKQEWKAGVDYYANSIFIRGTDGHLYKKINNQDGVNYDYGPPFNPNYLAQPISGANWSRYWERVTADTVDGARTTKQMMTKENYVGWDFENVWRIDEGKSYPYFRSSQSTQCTAFPLFRRMIKN
ncbi:hypothetical protein [Psychrobacillus sp. FSL K6-2843]|jgi:hypothetical protein|uniref:hypothetical protein n=1 Tax=Psychrobacillus sp. FSL K6-2843 TaxID=2921549 RepID=UPI00315A230D